MAELLVSQPLDLEASLMGGQAHRWRQEGEWYSGMVRGNFIKIRQLSPFPPFRVPCYAAPSPPLTRQGGTSPLSLTTFSLTKGGTTSSLPPDRGGIKGGVRLEFHCEPWPEASVAPLLHSYFRLDEDINTIYADICRDVRVEAMVARYPGLRVLRQEPWECLIALYLLCPTPIFLASPATWSPWQPNMEAP